MMLRRVLVRTIRSHAGPFLRYCVIGIMNTALDFTIYTVLTRTSPFWARHYLAANAVAFSIVVTWSFFWNKRWTFASTERRHRMQYAKFVLATLGGIGIAQTVLYTGVQLLGIRDLLAKLLAGPLVVLWNFFLYRYWAFGRSPSIAAATAPPLCPSDSSENQ